MSRTFYAICRVNGENVVHRIPISAGAQMELQALFDSQEIDFLKGRVEHAYEEKWKPDPEDLLVIHDPKLSQIFINTLKDSPAKYNHLDIDNHGNFDIKGIFTQSDEVQNRILLQKFSNAQYLQKRDGISMIFSNKLFHKLSDPGFTLDNRLTAIIEGEDLKFISFYNLRTVLDIQHHFKLATDDDVDNFQSHPILHVENVAALKELMDEQSRNLIHGILSSDVLNKFSANHIHKCATDIGLSDIEYNNGKFTLPEEKRKLKIFLKFLDDGVYKGIFSNKTFETNSRRPLG